MGRPLFSQSNQAPAVRIEPEQIYPECEKWTYWNAFDPDSDEFFDNQNAVYEAFIDHSQLPLEGEQGARSTANLMLAQDSASSSEASSSGRGTPTDGVEESVVDTPLSFSMSEQVGASADSSDGEDDDQLPTIRSDTTADRAAQLSSTLSALSASTAVGELAMIEQAARALSSASIDNTPALADGAHRGPSIDAATFMNIPNVTGHTSPIPVWIDQHYIRPAADTTAFRTWAPRNPLPGDVSTNSPLPNRYARRSIPYIPAPLVPVHRIIG